MTSTRICTHCSISFIPKSGSTGKFCSKSCSAKFNNTGRVRSEGSKQNTSTSIKRMIDSGTLKPPPKKFGEDHPRWRGIVKIRKCLECSSCNQPLKGKQKKFCNSCRCDTDRICTTCHTPLVGRLRKYCTDCKPYGHSTPKKPHQPVVPHKCLMCDTIIMNKNKTCSPACKIERSRQASSDHLRKNRHKYVGPHQRSWMERTFVAWLESHGITKGIYGYWDQVHFKHNPDGKTKNGWADFVFVSRRLIIELDGSHHKSRKHLDEVRDTHLSDHRGYKVIRITHAEYTKKLKLRHIHEALGI